MDFKQKICALDHTDSNQVLLICGVARSGTTLLWRLCNTHPDIQLTYEFSNFSSLGVPYNEYRRALLSHIRGREFYANRVLGLLQTRNRFRQINRILWSYVFIGRYLTKVGTTSSGIVDLSIVRFVLQQMLPGVKVLGDKFPGYIWSMDELSTVNKILPVVIYRDCRDVTSSTLARVRTDWRNASFARDKNSAEKVARRWVNAIEIMERNVSNIRMIRYENLTWEPTRTLGYLSEWLQVDPEGYLAGMISQDSIGKYK